MILQAIAMLQDVGGVLVVGACSVSFVAGALTMALTIGWRRAR